ncbi:FAD-binding oxidoreductase [Streptomonospora sediminis]
MTQTTRGAQSVAAELDQRSAGAVHTPGGGGYDRARTGYQLLEPHAPAVVVEAAAREDVRAAVEVAAGAGWPLAVQATGHGLGASMRGGVLVATGGMDGVAVDAGAAAARVQAGAPWSRVVEAAAPYGLAPLSGSLASVGAVSYTLGGGVGLLARRYGFAADHVRAVEVVTAEGRLREVSADSEPELFWALRGGGGNFGVVTAMEIGLVPVARVYGGSVYFDVGQVPDVLQAWGRWTRSVPEETTSAVTVLPFPDTAGVPEVLRGRHVAQVQICHAGPAEQGRRVVEPLLEAGEPLRTTLRELAYAESGAVFEEPDRPHGYRSRNLLLDALEPAALEELLRRGGPGSDPMCVVGLRHLGGALARAPRSAGAVGGRGAAYALAVLSPVEPGGEQRARARHDELLAPFAGRAVGRSLNFSFGPLPEAEVRAAFDPDTYRRLGELKARYDPGGVLRAAHPIAPAGPAARGR